MWEVLDLSLIVTDNMTAHKLFQSPVILLEEAWRPVR